MRQFKLKYNNSPVWWSNAELRESSFKAFPDSQYFASGLELDVYRRLQEFERLKIYRQWPLIIKHSTPVYRTINWACDFRVECRDNSSKFINFEAKGFVQPEFKRILQYLEYSSPDEYHHLVVVSRQPIKVDSQIVSVSINEIVDVLNQSGMR